MTRAEEGKLRAFETKVLRRIYGPVKENGIWHIRCTSEIYKLYDETEITKLIKTSRIRWLGQEGDLHKSGRKKESWTTPSQVDE